MTRQRRQPEPSTCEHCSNRTRGLPTSPHEAIPLFWSEEYDMWLCHKCTLDSSEVSKTA